MTLPDVWRCRSERMTGPLHRASGRLLVRPLHACQGAQLRHGRQARWHREGRETHLTVTRVWSKKDDQGVFGVFQGICEVLV